MRAVKRYSIARLWLRYGASLNKQGILIGSQQWNEMQKSFYIGVLEVLTLLRDELSELPEETASAHLQGMVDEGVEVLERGFNIKAQLNPPSGRPYSRIKNPPDER